MRHALSLLTAGLLATNVWSQQVGTNQPEIHPPITMSECTKGGCVQQQKSVVLDANWRWAHTTSGTTNCFTGNDWDKSICSDPVACAQNCAIDGANYANPYGISTSGDSLKLNFVTRGQYGNNVGSRVYLMNTDSTYEMFKLLNKEFTVDVDVSQLPCGLNGALYFVEMEEDGGMSSHAGNKAGARYGTGYCDAQCPHDMKWINGEANSKNWVPSPVDKNSGHGHYGTCCHEMDIWEANSMATAYTPHSCSIREQYRCEGRECGDISSGDRYSGVCDKDGCDFNSYRLRDTEFYGPGKQLDTNQKMTVITQFITSDNTSTGELVEIRRLWKQNGRIIKNSQVSLGGGSYDSITGQFCATERTAFGYNAFDKLGGLKSMGESLSRGVVLTLSLWDDYYAHMLWLDSKYPANGTKAGTTRGPCPTSSGVPADLEAQHPNSNVKFSNIKVGDIGTTY
eukprot:NODE_579_length_1530_cov_263.070223_g424_i0.p1 GENE.NODE_579_length_1530_cov_263.070223_g424_i0~~NODE_579_length_1530_cov_263.070223_g424_i0.p1  ORF type:complete len:471 (+),score=126.46 NODE_579_length_1530_cov_263.070223_g424_i0:54-1415(+)